MISSTTPGRLRRSPSSSSAELLARVLAARLQVAQADLKVRGPALAARRERTVTRGTERGLARLPTRVLLIGHIPHASGLAVLDARELGAHVDARVFLWRVIGASVRQVRCAGIGEQAMGGM